MDCTKLLGEWTVHSRPVLVYEFRYRNRGRIGIRLFYKPDNPNDPPEELGELSTNLTNTSLEPGEFSVKNFGDMKDIWKEMAAFPEFEVTRKRTLFRQVSNAPLHVCPIWRLCGCDCMDETEVDLSAREGGIVTTSVAECTFDEIKRLVKEVPTDKDIAEHLVVLRNFDEHLVNDIMGAGVNEIVK
ncbi:hypothetical protein QZH41_006299 [Actinostola sp. cb2023]|nr:hypothetical protein QZH41_006299 [Actinostola sp. cb2023]